MSVPNRILLKALLLVLLVCTSCGSSSGTGAAQKSSGVPDTSETDGVATDIPDTDSGIFRIAFGSCNKTELPNDLWDDILAVNPDLWIWGGDNIYADTEDIGKMRGLYKDLGNNPGYRQLAAGVPVIGTWDDHDYGLNDGGAAFSAKVESQQALLDFLGVPADSPRRDREGVYASHTYTFDDYSVKVIVLDTRYFRSPLRTDPTGQKRYLPHSGTAGTILGAAQWGWLEAELRSSRTDFNVVVSSIQVLSNEHGFESWGLFPDERQKLLDLIQDSGASRVVLLSGDRHISEFSRFETEALGYSLVDFTSSGLTHAYDRFSGEPNPYRVGEVVAEESFGLLILDPSASTIQFQIRADGGRVLQELRQTY